MRAAQCGHAQSALASALALWYDAWAMGDGSQSGSAPPPERSTTMSDTTTAELATIDAEVAADIAKQRSVVATHYKARYAERAVAAGTKRKAAQRSAWDWLAQSIAGECLGEKDRISIERFLALLDANGVDHSRWQNRSKGWEGRLRMTGRLALQRVVAEAGVLLTADGEELEAPAEWVAKYSN
jgi:hypothetical protein